VGTQDVAVATLPGPMKALKYLRFVGKIAGLLPALNVRSA